MQRVDSWALFLLTLNDASNGLGLHNQHCVRLQLSRLWIVQCSVADNKVIIKKKTKTNVSLRDFWFLMLKLTDWLMLYGVLLSCAGNDNLHLMTSDKRQRLRVDLADFEGNTSYAEYDNFKIVSGARKYRLVSLGNFTGTAGKYRYCFTQCLNKNSPLCPPS